MRLLDNYVHLLKSLSLSGNNKFVEAEINQVMSENTVLFDVSVEQLVREIVAVNHAWKVACELFGESSPLSTSSRDLKTCLQVRLLRTHAPKQVYLVEDKEAEGEPLYSLRLREPIDNRQYAEHLPVRVAQDLLTSAELKQFINN